MTKPEWWNDEGLKALSARVVRALPNEMVAHCMRASVLHGDDTTWPRSVAELKKAAKHYGRAAALCHAPAVAVQLIGAADLCRTRSQAEGMSCVCERLLTPL